ncbi:hypothetical protein PYW07_004304 [Mythimna separata]|uniref:MADF domain-containing protein n=1 Tax=Mythimna separata TaxID=271217 RepID=A0AAD7YVV9_MYTSE|nr:hypothetical protein PYW07_009632 [Mythimna separata]KAJ8728511.1 hypothetical protein PYW07_006207 [Mythimna separata]KAJ8728944.1 hypothetical protein PYW07_006640 [Mythimna separata]KAJ8729023.1 hypothetical protein PYW07_006719 [Mythimna separata]KAJ8731140.1 hypothetical protein PYW07_004304 [Mythimna separata]
MFEYAFYMRERARAAAGARCRRVSPALSVPQREDCVGRAFTTSRRRQLEIMDEEKLISLVQRFECLYNISSPTYSDRMLKVNAWEKVSQEMGKPVG